MINTLPENASGRVYNRVYSVKLITDSMTQNCIQKQEIQYTIFYIKKRSFLILDGFRTVFFPGQLFIIESDKIALSKLSNKNIQRITFSATILLSYLSSSNVYKQNKIVTHIKKNNYLSVDLYNKEYVDKAFELFQLADTDEKKKICIHFLLCCFNKQKNFLSFCLSHFGYCRKTESIIISDIKRSWLLSDVASYLCLSASTLKKKLNEEGQTFSSILTKCRMKLASELLLLSNKNISQVATECGYKNTSYFITVFSRFYGIRPGRYRYALYNRYS